MRGYKPEWEEALKWMDNIEELSNQYPMCGSPYDKVTISDLQKQFPQFNEREALRIVLWWQENYERRSANL